MQVTRTKKHAFADIRDLKERFLKSYLDPRLSIDDRLIAFAVALWCEIAISVNFTEIWKQHLERLQAEDEIKAFWNLEKDACIDIIGIYYAAESICRTHFNLKQTDIGLLPVVTNKGVACSSPGVAISHVFELQRLKWTYLANGAIREMDNSEAMRRGETRVYLAPVLDVECLRKAICTRSISQDALRWITCLNEESAKQALESIKKMSTHGSLFADAIARGDIEAVKLLIVAGADVNERLKSGETALHVVAKQPPTANCKGIAEILIAAGADIVAKSDDNRNVLHFAAEGGNAEVLEIFLDKNDSYDFGTIDEGLPTPVHLAAQTGNVDILKMLLQYGCLNTMSENLPTPTHMAAQSGNVQCLQMLIDVGQSVDALANYRHCFVSQRWSALHAAARHGQASCVNALIRNKCTVDNAGIGDSWTPLGLALLHCHPWCAITLASAMGFPAVRAFAERSFQMILNRTIILLFVCYFLVLIFIFL